MTAFRTATGSVLKMIKIGSGGGSGPDAIAITPNGKTVYVPSYGDGTVTPIRTATSSALKPVKVGPDPVAIAITPNGKTAYVVSSVFNYVTPIRTATSTALKADQGRRRPGSHRDHAGREDRLRRQRRPGLLRDGHGHPDPHRDRYRAQADQGGG